MPHRPCFESHRKTPNYSGLMLTDSLGLEGTPTAPLRLPAFYSYLTEPERRHRHRSDTLPRPTAVQGL